MEKLPRSILLKIFSKLNSDDLLILKNVNRAFDDIIDKEIGITLHVGLGNSVYWREGLDWLPVKAIREIGISKCYFSEVEDQLPSKGFKYPHLVRELSFDGFIERTHFNRLIHSVSSTLSRITIHTSTLCFLRSTHLKSWNLPVLDELQIYCYGCNADMSWSYLDDCIIDNFAIIMSHNHFPALVSLRISMLFVAKREREMTLAIIKFVARHSLTLRRLRMEFRYEGTTNDEVLFNAKDEVLMKLAIKLHPIQLNYFKMHFWYNGGPRLMNVWSELLKQQYNLGTFVYVTGDGWNPFPAQIVANNQSSLVRLTIRMNMACDFFDCQMFQYCHNLKRLCMMNKDQRTTSSRPKKSKKKKKESIWINAPVLCNPKCLPKQIDTLFISWIKVHKDDVHTIYGHLPMLKELNLTFIGAEGVFGIDRNTLASFFASKKLKRFTVLQGFNKTSCALTEDESRDPHQCIVAALLQYPNLCLDVSKNLHGYYDIIS